jgi:hypothetical protein
MAGAERVSVRRVLGLRLECVARGWRIAIQCGWKGPVFPGERGAESRACGYNCSRRGGSHAHYVVTGLCLRPAVPGCEQRCE